MRKPVVYPLVFVPILGIGGFCVPVALVFAYCRIKEIRASDLPQLNGMLISLPACFLCIPTSFLLGNLVLHWIAPLRRIAEQYVAETRGPGFAESQKMLLKALLAFALICVPLIVLGFVL